MHLSNIKHTVWCQGNRDLFTERCLLNDTFWRCRCRCRCQCRHDLINKEYWLMIMRLADVWDLDIKIGVHFVWKSICITLNLLESHFKCASFWYIFVGLNENQSLFVQSSNFDETNRHSCWHFIGLFCILLTIKLQTTLWITLFFKRECKKPTFFYFDYF